MKQLGMKKALAIAVILLFISVSVIPPTETMVVEKSYVNLSHTPHDPIWIW